jgi:cysteine desulfurase
MAIPDDVVYLDHNASTPCDPRVVQAMMPFFSDTYANPSSRGHRPGQDAASAVEEARSAVAHCLGAHTSSEIVFTSGATEANNLVLLGLAREARPNRRHIVTQVTEHPSVLEPLHRLERDGWSVSRVGVDNDGRVRPQEVLSSLRDDTVLVSLMLANNETGTLQPVEELAVAAHDHGALFHCDAAQGIGKVPIDLSALKVDFLTFSAHKAYGPKGAGGLFIRRTRPPLRLPAMLLGGGQESGLRSGTVNLPAIAGMAHAFELAVAEFDEESTRLTGLRDRFEARLLAEIEGVTVNGSMEHRLPGTSNLSITGVEANALMVSLPDLAISTGSACTSSTPEPSPVLRAMGVAKHLAASSIRVSVGRFTTDADVTKASERIVEEVTRLRGLRKS